MCTARAWPGIAEITDNGGCVCRLTPFGSLQRKDAKTPRRSAAQPQPKPTVSADYSGADQEEKPRNTEDTEKTPSEAWLRFFRVFRVIRGLKDLCKNDRFLDRALQKGERESVENGLPWARAACGRSFPASFARVFLGVLAFDHCTSLTGVIIGNGVTSIGVGAFFGCGSLMAVYFEGNAPSVDLFAFYSDNNASVYYLPETTGWGTTFGGRPTALWVLPPRSANTYIVRKLPIGYAPGVPVTITLQANPPANTTLYALEDRPPARMDGGHDQRFRYVG
jgi:hypothetical protein